MTKADFRYQDEHPHEECGVFGLFAPGEDVARICYFGLYTLQHRGQESAGIATANCGKIYCHKKMGLVSQVFDETLLSQMKGDSAIGHVRYSTTGSSVITNAQPLVFNTNLDNFALAHNGNLVNSSALRRHLTLNSDKLVTNSDSELIGKTIANVPEKNWESKITKGLKNVHGSYSLLILTEKQLYAVRDPLGVRPLVLGRFNRGWVVSSESCALDTIGAQTIRELLPGEGIRIDESGVTQFIPPHVGGKSGFCIFEYIYFARPDSVLNKKLVYAARLEMGKQLCREHPVQADFVIPIPDSATAAAIGFAEAAGLPFYEGLIKSRYIGRTFIQPDENLRRLGVKLKFNTLPQILKDKRVIVVDDSIVRGNTTKQIVLSLRQAGVQQIHLRISSPPLRHPCYLGIDIASYDELIAHHKTILEIQRFLGVETLGYLSLKGLKKAIGKVQSGYCTGCFTGRYPLKKPSISHLANPSLDSAPKFAIVKANYYNNR